MKIAIMGAVDSVEKIYDVLSSDYKNVEFVKYAQDEIKKLADLAENLDADVEGIFFTGVAVYTELKSKLNFKQPVVYTQRGTVGIIKALLDFQKDFESTRDLNLAFDIVSEKELKDVLDEFSIEIKGYTIKKYTSLEKEEDYISYYIKQYNDKKIDCVFTSFGYIYNYLKMINIPVYRIQTTNIDIKNQFVKLLNIINLKKIDKRVIQIQLVKASGVHQKDFEEELQLYAREIEGLFQTTGEGEYLIISNKGALLSHENLMSFRQIIDKQKDAQAVIGTGIGEGLTLYQSETNARNALRKSLAEKKSNIYFYDGEHVIGPITTEAELQYKNVFDKDTVALAKQIGISSQYIEKIISIISKLGRDEFTSQELSEILSISERSVNRILKKIIDAGYGKETNVETSLSAGRPRRIIKIQLSSQ